MGDAGSVTDTMAVGQDKRMLASRRLAFADNAVLHVGLLCALPLVLLLLNTGWIYNQPGFIDTWIYVSFFENYDVPQYFVGEKKILRLPWIWTGFAVYRLFPPLVANYVVHLIALLGAPIALYFFLRKFFAGWIAFFVAVSLLLYVPFHGPGGWDYHDAFGGLFYIFTFWSLSNAATRSDATRWMMLAGAAWSVALHANIIFVNWTPLLILQFIVLGGIPTRRQFWRLAVAGLIGVVATTLLFCVGNYLDGRSFFFHWILLQRVFTLVTDPELQIWWRPWSSFLGRDGLPLALLAAMLIPAGWLVATRWRKLLVASANAGTVALALQAQFIVAAAILVIWQAQGQTSLQPWYMAEPILYPAMLALAGQLHLANEARDYRGIFVLLVVPAIYVAFIAGCKALGLDHRLAQLAPTINDGNVALIAFALYLVAVGCLHLGRGRFAGFVAFAILLAAANVMHILKAPGYVTLDGVPTSRVDVYGYPPTCELRQDLYLTTVQANRYLAALKINPASIALWWDDDERFGLPENDACRFPGRYLAIPIANTGFISVSNPAAPTPNDVLGPQRIAVLAGDAAHKQATIERINKLSKQVANVSWVPVDEKQFDTPVLKTSITLLKPRSEFPEQAGATHLGNPFKGFDASGKLRVTVPTGPWNYGGVYQSARQDLKGPLWIEITGRFTGGPFGAGLLSSNNRDFSVRRRVDADPETQHVTLILPDGAPLGDLVFQSWAEGNAGEAEVDSVDVVAPAR
jgi:hypothetical protein